MKNKLFLGGIIAPLLYLLNDIVGGIITPHYSYITNTVSDLTKAGSTYTLGSVILFFSALASILFAVGIISKYSPSKSRLVFLVGVFLLIIGIFNILTGTIFPQDPIGQPLTFHGKMHLFLVGLSLLLTFVIIPFAGIGLYREENIKFFKIYSFLSITLMFVFGLLSALAMKNGIGVLGLLERCAVYTFQIWNIVLAYLLIRKPKESFIKQE